MSKSDNIAIAAVGKVKDAAVERIEERRTENQQRKAVIAAAEMMGAIRITQSVARTFSAQSFRALRHFAQEKLYIEYGYSSMDEFLQNDPNSPMNKSAYYDRLNALDSEGDGVFDALNEMKVPFTSRKLLAGQVTIEGDEIVLGDQRANMSDHSAVKQIITAFVKENAAQTKKLERGAADNLKLKEKLRNAEVTGTSAPLPETVTGALLTLGGAHTHLHNVLRQLPLVDRKRYYQRAIGDQAQWNQSVLLQLFKIDDAPDANEYEIPDDLIEGME